MFGQLHSATIPSSKGAAAVAPRAIRVCAVRAGKALANVRFCMSRNHPADAVGQSGTIIWVA